MTARGPYYVSKDAWVAQPVGSTVQYGNGSGTLVHFGAVPSSVPTDPDFKSRGMFEISATDMATFLASASSVDSAYVDMFAGTNGCMGSRGANTRLLLEVMTTDFSANAKTGCNLSSGTGAAVWGQSNNVTTINRAFFSGSSLATGDRIRFDITAIMEARRAASDASALRFRVISANLDGSGYDETTAARRISVYSLEHSTVAERPQLSGTVTTGGTPKSFSDTITFAEVVSASQTGINPAFNDTLTFAETFSGSAPISWSTVLEDENNGEAKLYLPSAGASSYALLPDVSEADIELRCKVQLDAVPEGGYVSFWLMARVVDGDNYYRARIAMGGTLHDIQLSLDKVVDGTATALQYITDIRTFLPATDFWVKLRVVEGQLNAKLWRSGETEPGWFLQIEDDEFAAAGAVGIGGSVSVNVTNAPITLSIDQFEGYEATL